MVPIFSRQPNMRRKLVLILNFTQKLSHIKIVCTLPTNGRNPHCNLQMQLRKILTMLYGRQQEDHTGFTAVGSSSFREGGYDLSEVSCNFFLYLIMGDLFVYLALLPLWKSQPILYSFPKTR